MFLKIYNTRTRDFHFIEKKEVIKVYACGPTVYNYAHIGNLRTYISEDLLIKSLKILGYNLIHALNITDVGHLTGDLDDGEDKVSKAAKERHLKVCEITTFFTNAFFDDLHKLNILKPNKIMIASEYVSKMIEIIKVLEDKGFTYFVNGNVYFDTSCDLNYGTMMTRDAKKNIKTLVRVEVDNFKKNQNDFVLWFTNSKFQNQIQKWKSPWGIGYPSWHVECAAMNLDYFKDNLDIHLGGIDHIKIHHTNEIAIVENFLGKRWCDLFLHFEFLIIEDSKMSKSDNNFITLRDLENEKFSALDFRYLCLNVHYRSQMKFTFNSLKASKSARENLISRLKSSYLSISKDLLNLLDEKPNLENEIGYYNIFLEKILCDLNIPQCLALLWDVVKDKKLQNLEKIRLALKFDEVFSLNLKKEILEKNLNKEMKFSDDMKLLIEERKIAKKNGNFKKADEIRDYFASKGLILIDSKEGTRVKERS